MATPSRVTLYRQVLLELREELVADSLVDGDSETVELDQSKVGRLSRMDALQRQQISLETKRRHIVKLRAVDGALRRIESDDFGSCFICGVEISEARLSVDPTLTRCRDCVEKETD